MWNLNDAEREGRLLKTVQKWLEYKTTEHEDIDENATVLAHERALKSSQEIVARLGIKGPKESAYLLSWIEISYFAGFLAGWRDFKNLSPTKPRDFGSAGLEAFTKESWAIEPAHDYARKTADDLFGQLLAPPVSPLVSEFSSTEIDFIKQTVERSLFAGYLDGLEQAFSTKSLNLSTSTFDTTIDV
jgi:hypothetical protein